MGERQTEVVPRVIPSRIAMNADSQIPQTVAVTLAVLEKMVRDGQRRRDMLKSELILLRGKERLLGATENVRWLVTQFIEPREAELASLEAQLKLLHERIAEVRQTCSAAAPTRPWVWVETGSPHILALTA